MLTTYSLEPPLTEEDSHGSHWYSTLCADVVFFYLTLLFEEKRPLCNRVIFVFFVDSV